MGSTNTDRDLDFRTNGESDVDIISNPSQSSIEVLDQFSSRKTSEERRISHIPSLETIDDQSYTQTFLEREFDNMINYARKDKPEEYVEAPLSSTAAAVPLYQKEMEHQESAAVKATDETTKKSSTSTFTQNNLTESSSSGSVTDSICTAYEQNGKSDVNKEFMQQEANDNIHNNADNTAMKKEDGNNGLSMFGGKYRQR